jgi:hypothetical protein
MSMWWLVLQAAADEVLDDRMVSAAGGQATPTWLGLDPGDRPVGDAGRA